MALNLDALLDEITAGIEDVTRNKTATELELAGWETWWRTIFGDDLVDAFAPHHREAVIWHWNSRMQQLAGIKPKNDAYFAPWSRGHLKSTLARRIAVADACLSKKGYCLYVGGTDDKVKGHALSMESLIASESIRKYYPTLARVRKSSQGSSKGWTQKFIYTDQGYIFHFVSLDKGVAGANIDNIRPTLIVPDDIDDRQDSPAVAQKRFEVLTTEVLPTKQEGTLFFFAQNVINRYSVMYRALKQTARILTNRFPTQPIPAIENLVTEERTVKGMVKDIVVSGTPTWHKYGLERAQEDIDVFGLDAFLAECQHEVDQNKQGLILPEWNEKVHIISWSQFQSVFGVRHIPHHWRKYVGHDWGSIHPCVMSYVATSSANAVLPHIHFTWGITTFKQNTMPDETALALINRLMPMIDTSILETQTKDTATRAIRAEVERWLQTEGANYDTWHMSHEARTVRDHYNITYGIPFAPCNPKAAGGVEQMRHFLRPDYSQPNPFKPGENGLAGWYFIVDDDQVEEARDDRGLKLLREQFPQWSWRNVGLTETGLQADKPMKVFDDIGNSLMMLFSHFSLGPTPYTAEEKQEMALSKGLRREDIEKMAPQQADYALILREWELKQQQKNNKLGNNHWSGEILDTGDDFRAYWKE